MGMHTVDTVSGDFSLGIMGERIEKGPADAWCSRRDDRREFLDLLASMEAVGKDLVFSGIARLSHLVGARRFRRRSIGGRTFMKVFGNTQIFGIMGCPVEHSLSPFMHNAAFEALGIHAVYVPFMVKPEDLGKAALALRALTVSGVNVTCRIRAR